MAPDARSSRAASGLRCVSYSSGILVCLPIVCVGGYVGNGSDETHPLGIGMALTPAANRMTVESLILTLDAPLE